MADKSGGIAASGKSYFIQKLAMRDLALIPIIILVMIIGSFVYYVHRQRSGRLYVAPGS